MPLSARRPGRKGRPMPGFSVCVRCLALVDNHHLVEMVRPGASKGIWWCPQCVTETTGTESNHE